MWRIPKRKLVGISRVARILSTLIRVGPFGRIGVADRVVQHVVGLCVAGAAFPIAAGRFRNPAQRVLLVFGSHGLSLPVAPRGKSVQRDATRMMRSQFGLFFADGHG
jgi:hypothetical protein